MIIVRHYQPDPDRMTEALLRLLASSERQTKSGIAPQPAKTQSATTTVSEGGPGMPVSTSEHLHTSPKYTTLPAETGGKGGEAWERCYR